LPSVGGTRVGVLNADTLGAGVPVRSTAGSCTRFTLTPRTAGRFVLAERAVLVARFAWLFVAEGLLRCFVDLVAMAATP
jgi:hypothetical protein